MYIFPTTHIEIHTQNPKQIEFVKGPWPNFTHLELGSKYSSRVNFRLKNKICINNAPIILKISKFALYYKTNVFSWRVRNPTHSYLELGSKWFLRVNFQLKDKICIKNAPITHKISRFSQNYKTNVFHVGSVTQFKAI